MPVVAVNNFTVARQPDDKVVITAWMRDKDAKEIQAFRVKPKEGSVVESHGKGVQNKPDMYRRYDFVVLGKSIRATEGTGGWSVAIPKTSVILSLGVHNRKQNPKYPIQTPEQIAAIIGCTGAEAGKKKKKVAEPKPDEVQANVESDEE